MSAVPIKGKAPLAGGARIQGKDQQQPQNSQPGSTTQGAGVAPRSARLKPLGGNRFRLTTNYSAFSTVEEADIRRLYIERLKRLLSVGCPVYFVQASSEGASLLELVSVVAERSAFDVHPNWYLTR